MQKVEIAKLFNRIKNHYITFTTGDEKIDEWFRFLKDYSSEDINKRLDEYLTYEYDNPPLCMSLIKGVNKIDNENSNSSWITCCDICKQKIKIYGNDMEEYEKHRRKCSKIDFIDRMSKKCKGKGITMTKYYEMSDIDLDIAYHKILNFYLENRNKDDKVLKEMPNDD